MLEKIIIKLKRIFIPSEENDFKPGFLKSRFLFYYLLVLIVLKIGVVLLVISLPQNIFFADVSRAIIMELANKQREDLGLLPLKENPQLNEAALLKAKDMITKNYFGHQSPRGTSPWDWLTNVGYDYQAAGENLGIGFLDSEEIYQAWNDSSSHKANLLNPKYKETGIAILQGYFKGNKTTVVVQFFGSEKKGVELFFEPQTVSAKESPEATGQVGEVVQPSEVPSDLVSAEVSSERGLKFRLLKFMAKDYSNLLQKIIFYSLFLICIALIVNIIIKPDIQNRQLIIKTLKILSLLILLVLLNKAIILKLIPHTLGIN